MALGVESIVRRIEWLEKQFQRLRSYLDDLRDELARLKLALAGIRDDSGNARRQYWARASTPIGPPSGTLGAQMTGGTVRLWFVDDDGLRFESALDVTAYNGWAGETVPANAWMRVERNNIWEIVAWECA